MIRLLVRGGESAKDEDVLLGDLEEATTFETDPVCVLLDFQVEGLPLDSPLQIHLLYQVCPLAPVESSHHEEGCILKGNRGMEVSLRV